MITCKQGCQKIQSAPINQEESRDESLLGMLCALAFPDCLRRSSVRARLRRHASVAHQFIVVVIFCDMLGDLSDCRDPDALAPWSKAFGDTNSRRLPNSKTRCG